MKPAGFTALTQNETFPACALLHVQFITVGIKAEGAKLIVPKLVIVFTINEEIGFSLSRIRRHMLLSAVDRLIIKCLWIYFHYMTESIRL